MKAFRNVSRVLVIVAVVLLVVMLMMDSAEANRGNRSGRRGRRGVRKLPLRGLEKCLCGKINPIPECTACFDKLRDESVTDWTTFGTCLTTVQTVPTPDFNSTCTTQASSRRNS
ncbi:uncharacterized protein LOC123518202 [Portunus trituberculatus]|uniref:uncharacterized protein LOC123518202 n=1 Tax=Portunus trituberculatus TaxID=210409 RepID=UPI001E1CBF6D|nr:uncharacterized protein LOC123518202 [Portunus trituberculatus]